MCAQLGAWRSPVLRLHGLWPLHLLGGSNFDPSGVNVSS